jgi:hypothetical protein
MKNAINRRLVRLEKPSGTDADRVRLFLTDDAPPTPASAWRELDCTRRGAGLRVWTEPELRDLAAAGQKIVVFR